MSHFAFKLLTPELVSNEKFVVNSIHTFNLSDVDIEVIDGIAGFDNLSKDQIYTDRFQVICLSRADGLPVFALAN